MKKVLTTILLALIICLNIEPKDEHHFKSTYLETSESEEKRITKIATNLTEKNKLKVIYFIFEENSCNFEVSAHKARIIKVGLKYSKILNELELSFALSHEIGHLEQKLSYEEYEYLGTKSQTGADIKGLNFLSRLHPKLNPVYLEEVAISVLNNSDICRGYEAYISPDRLDAIKQWSKSHHK